MAGQFSPVPGETTRALNKITKQISFDMAISIQRGTAQALERGVADASVLFVEALAKSLARIESSDRGVFLAANKRLAASMRAAMLASYDQTVTARKKFPSYRIGQGRLATKLRAALADKDMVVATPQGIAYINNDILDREAAHWARLNYGAEPAVGRTAGSFPWVFRGADLGTLSLDWAPSARFKMPRGIWTEEGFFPRGRELKVPTKGIQARRFFDAGLARFVQDFPSVYGDVLDTFIDQGVQGQGPLPRVGVNAKALFFIRGLQ